MKFGQFEIWNWTAALTKSFDGFIERFAALYEIFTNFGLGENDDSEQLLAAGYEGSAVIHPPDVGGRISSAGILLGGEVAHHLQDDVVGAQELQRRRRQKDFGVERLDDGQRLGHGLHQSVHRQVIDDDPEGVAAQTVDEAGRFAILPVLR